MRETILCRRVAPEASNLRAPASGTVASGTSPKHSPRPLESRRIGRAGCRRAAGGAARGFDGLSVREEVGLKDSINY
jgi:hypothetical protein